MNRIMSPPRPPQKRRVCREKPQSSGVRVLWGQEWARLHEAITKSSRGLLVFTQERLIFLRHDETGVDWLKIPYETIENLSSHEPRLALTYVDRKRQERVRISFVVQRPPLARTVTTLEVRQRMNRASHEVGPGTGRSGPFDGVAYSRLIEHRLPHLTDPAEPRSSLEWEIALFPSLLRLDETVIDLVEASLDPFSIGLTKPPNSTATRLGVRMFRRGHRGLLGLTDRRLVFFIAEDRFAGGGEFVIAIPYALIGAADCTAAGSMLTVTIASRADARVVMPRATSPASDESDTNRELKLELFGKQPAADAQRLSNTISRRSQASTD